MFCLNFWYSINNSYWQQTQMIVQKFRNFWTEKLCYLLCNFFSLFTLDSYLKQTPWILTRHLVVTSPVTTKMINKCLVILQIPENSGINNSGIFWHTYLGNVRFHIKFAPGQDLMSKNSCLKIPELIDMIRLPKMSKYLCFPKIGENIDIWTILVMSKYGFFLKIRNV